MAMDAAKNRAADQGGIPGRPGHDRGSARRRRPLCGARSFRRLSPARAACSSIRWSIRRWAAAWAASCTRWRCRPARRRPERLIFERESRGSGRMSQRPTMSDHSTASASEIGKNTCRAVHEGHAGISAMRLLGRGGAGPQPSGRQVQRRRRAGRPRVRQGIKEFSSWPTIPQLYVKGEFIGGCDIIREMFETGELKQLLKEKGVSLAHAA